MDLPNARQVEEWTEYRRFPEVPLSTKELKAIELRRMLQEIIKAAKEGDTKLSYRISPEGFENKKILPYLFKKLNEQDYQYRWYEDLPEVIYIDWALF